MKEIAELKGVSKEVLYQWKYKRKDQLNGVVTATQPDTSEEKQTNCKCTKEDKTAEYEAKIKELEDKVAELKFLHSACEDVETECDKVRKERNEYQQLYLQAYDSCLKKDYLLQNQKESLVHLRKTLGTLTAENQYLWGLVGIQAAEKVRT